MDRRSRPGRRRSVGIAQRILFASAIGAHIPAAAIMLFNAIVVAIRPLPVFSASIPVAHCRLLAVANDRASATISLFGKQR